MCDVNTDARRLFDRPEDDWFGYVKDYLDDDKKRLYHEVISISSGSDTSSECDDASDDADSDRESEYGD